MSFALAPVVDTACQLVPISVYQRKPKLKMENDPLWTRPILIDAIEEAIVDRRRSEKKDAKDGGSGGKKRTAVGAAGALLAGSLSTFRPFAVHSETDSAEYLPPLQFGAWHPRRESVRVRVHTNNVRHAQSNLPYPNTAAVCVCNKPEQVGREKECVCLCDQRKEHVSQERQDNDHLCWVEGERGLIKRARETIAGGPPPVPAAKMIVSLDHPKIEAPIEMTVER